MPSGDSMARFVGLFVALILGGMLAMGHDSGTTSARDTGPGVVPGRYIVVLQPGVDAASLALGRGAVPDHVYSHALNGFAAALSPLQAASLKADPRVLSVEQDQVVSIAGQETPTGVQRIFAPGNGNIDIDGADDWRVDVDVAVIDTGIDAAHPDLNVVSSVNCSGGGPFTSSCSSGGTDDNSHGTHVAGTIGALDNGVGVVGVAPGARLWAVKVLNSQGSGYMSWIVAGIDYVAANSSIEVANMSLGCECTSAAMNTAIANAVSKGVVFVVAAGNSDKDSVTFSPANHPDVITVSALADFNGLPGGGAASTCRTDQDDTLADFSNFGPSVEIAAPGVCITSTVPGGGYAIYSGTSMASPHAAGAAALLASMSKPTDKTQALAVGTTLRNAGNYNWTDDSGDGIKEPLLDVSNTTVFNPVLVAGTGGGGGGGGGGGEQGTMTASVSGSATGTNRNWTATATATVLDQNSQPLGGAVVTATWNGGAAATCTTGTNGTCSMSKTMNKKTTSVTFQVTGVVRDGYAYVGGYPSVTINKP